MLKDVPWLTMRRSGRVVVLRLHRVARSIEELGQMTNFLDTSHRQCQSQLLVLALPALGLEPPSDQMRSLILSNIRKRFTTHVIERAFLVVPTGNILRRALVRSLFTGIRLSLGLHNRVFMVDTVEAAVQELATRHGIARAELLALAGEMTVGSDGAPT